MVFRKVVYLYKFWNKFRSTSVVQENAARPFRCDVPQMFFFFLAWGWVDNDWIYIFSANCSFKWLKYMTWNKNKSSEIWWEIIVVRVIWYHHVQTNVQHMRSTTRPFAVIQNGSQMSAVWACVNGQSTLWPPRGKPFLPAVFFRDPLFTLQPVN